MKNVSVALGCLAALGLMCSERAKSEPLPTFDAEEHVHFEMGDFACQTSELVDQMYDHMLRGEHTKAAAMYLSKQCFGPDLHTTYKVLHADMLKVEFEEIGSLEGSGSWASTAHVKRGDAPPVANTSNCPICPEGTIRELEWNTIAEGDVGDRPAMRKALSAVKILRGGKTLYDFLTAQPHHNLSYLERAPTEDELAHGAARNFIAVEINENNFGPPGKSVSAKCDEPIDGDVIYWKHGSNYIPRSTLANWLLAGKCVDPTDNDR